MDLAAKALVSGSIRAIPDFPKKGILFQDVTTLLLNPEVGEAGAIGGKGRAGAARGGTTRADPHCPAIPLIHQAFQACIDDLVARYAGAAIDAVAGFEARGFIFGPPLALARRVPFVPLRKPGKLPGKVVSRSYELEYGTDTLEMHADALTPGAVVVLVDDLVATGGTLEAGIALVRSVGATVFECAAVIELPELGGRARLAGVPLYVQVEKEEHVPNGNGDNGANGHATE